MKGIHSQIRRGWGWYLPPHFIAPDAETAEEYLGRIRAYAERLHLVLTEEKIARVPWGRDFAFCKERFIFNRQRGS